MRFIFLFVLTLYIYNFAHARQTEDVQRIVGNNTPDDFANFINSAPNPNYSGDATYSIPLANVIAGGGLDFPLTLTYNSNAIRENTQSGYVGFGWDLNIGEVVRAVNHLPDEQNTANFGPNEVFYLGGYSDPSARFAEWDGIINTGDMISTKTVPSAIGDVPVGPNDADHWDNYNISTPFGNANLVPVVPSNGITQFYFQENPYQSWQIDYTRSASYQDYFKKFNLTDNRGRKFVFDYAHFARIDYNGDGVKTTAETNGNNSFYRFPISWKLTKIESPNSDHYVDIIYDDYAHAGESISSAVTTPYEVTGGKNSIVLAGKRIPEDIFGRITYDESVIESIKTLTHTIVFDYVDDNTHYSINGIKRKLLQSVKVYSNKNLSQSIKEITLGYNTSAQHKATNAYTNVNLLSKVTFFDPKGDVQNPHSTNEYEFQYFPNVTSVIPDKFGYLKKNNLLKTILLPLGGTIEFEYEERRYSFYYDYDQQDEYLDQIYEQNNSAGEFLSGSRVSKITLNGISSDSPTIIKEYSYGDGVRVDNNWESIISNYGSAKGYSNRILGHVGHRWVEEKDSEGGFQRIYYTSGISHPDLHINQCYFAPVDLPDHCPSFINEEEAMSVAFGINPESSFSGLTYYTNFNESYGKPYKSEIGYYSGSRIVKQSSESKWIRVESDQKHPQPNPNFNSDVNTLSVSSFTYKLYDKVSLDGKETSTYYVGHTYNDDAAGGNSRPRFHNFHAIKTPPQFVITVDESDESTFVKEYSYLGGWGWAHNRLVNMIDYQISDFTLKEVNAEYGGLYRTVICDLGIAHPVSCPSGTTPLPKYPGLSAAFYSGTLKFNAGQMTYWNNDDGKYRPRETWAFTDTNLDRYIDPCTSPYCSVPLNADSSGSNTGFNLPYSNNGRLIQTYDKYDNIGNLIQLSDGLGKLTSFDFTTDGKLVGVFDNAESNYVFTHSFAYDGLDGLPNPVDGANGASTTWSISNGKLQMHHPGNTPTSYEVDYINMQTNTEYNARTIVELDIIAGPDDIDRTLTIGVGGSSYQGGNGGGENLVWTMFSFGNWEYYDGSWKTIKTGFEQGKEYNLKIIADPAVDKADYYVNGKLVLQGANKRESTDGIQTVGIGNYARSATKADWFIDNVRIYPEQAQAITQELDWYSQKALKIKGIEGFSEQYSYDGFSRLISYRNNLGKIVSENRYLRGNNLTTLMSQYDGYSLEVPNQVISISYTSGIEEISLYDTWSLDGYIDSQKGLVGLANSTIDFAPGRFGLAASFGGGSNNDHIEIGDIEFMDNASEFSISLWFKRTTDGSSSTANSVNNILIAQSSSASNDNFEIGTDGNNIELYLDTGSGSEDVLRTFNAGIVNNKWYHLAFTYNSFVDQAIIYVNGQKVKTWTEWKNNLQDSGNAPLSLGLSRPDEDNYGDYNGLIDEVKLFSTALSYDEIKSLYDASTSINYTDGLGRGIQSQVISGQSSIILGEIYDGRSLGVASSNPAGDIGNFGYRKDLFSGTSSFTPGNALPETSLINQYYYQHVDAGDEDYAYSFIDYEPSKSNRVLKTTLPGYTHRFGTGNENTISYGQNGVAISTPNKTWVTNTLNKTISQDPSNNQSISYTNYLGQTVVSGVDMDNTGELSGSSDLITKFEYDYNGNLALVEDPRGIRTTYSHNAIGDLQEKKLPDQDHPNKYCYDEKGRLRIHANPNNFDDPFNYNATDHYGYSYIKYDIFDRTIEIGEQDAAYTTSNSQASFNIICQNSTLLNDQNEPSANNTPTIIYDYDGINASFGAQNYKGRLTRAKYIDQNSGQWGYTWYSYNTLGLVEWVKQRLPGRSNYDDRTISYNYDEFGRITKVSYDEGYSSTNDHYFWYYYDEFGRLEKVASYGSNIEASALIEAEYTYYADGQVEQLILGNGAQEVDYDYTIQGWLKDINSGTSSGTDQFGMALEYTNNGNISNQQWSQAAFSTGTYNYFYDYDSANRLKKACYEGVTCTTTGDYDVIYGYDESGNIDFISRNGSGSEPNLDFIFTFETGTNKINSVGVDGISGETQTQYKQFDYDASGNVTENGLQGIASDGVGITAVTYDWRNLPTSLSANGSTLTYAYDADGNRVKKKIGTTETWYVRGADGQTIAAYQGSTLLYINILAGGQIIGQIEN